MFAVTAQGLLRVWEAQQRAHPVQRAVQLLSEVAPPLGLDGWLHAPIGVRDGALMHLCETLFGGELHTATTCPHCGATMSATHYQDQLDCPSCRKMVRVHNSRYEAI